MAIKNRPMRCLLIASAIFLASASLTPHALAYNNSGNPGCAWSYSGGYSLLTIYWTANPSYPPTSDYTTPYSNGRTNWYNSNTPAAFSNSAGATYHGVIYEGADGHLGTTYISCSGSYIQSASVYLNRTYLEPGNGNACSTSFTREYTAFHELGHNIGLGHSSYSSALMYGSYICGSPPSYSTPQSDDECGVNHIYPSTGWPPACGY